MTWLGHIRIEVNTPPAIIRAQEALIIGGCKWARGVPDKVRPVGPGYLLVTPFKDISWVHDFSRTDGYESVPITAIRQAMNPEQAELLDAGERDAMVAAILRDYSDEGEGRRTTRYVTLRYDSFAKAWVDEDYKPWAPVTEDPEG